MLKTTKLNILKIFNMKRLINELFILDNSLVFDPSPEGRWYMYLLLSEQCPSLGRNNWDKADFI